MVQQDIFLRLFRHLLGVTEPDSIIFFCMLTLDNSIEFNSISKEHRLALEVRGYRNIEQTCLDNYLIRNAPWKTYWQAFHPEFGNVFIKINYGYEERTNAWMGKKEAGLAKFFSKHYEKTTNIFFPHVFDHWKAGKAYIVIFKNVTFVNHSIFSLIQTVQKQKLVLEMLDVWNNILPPAWWSDNFVIHDFAGHKKLNRSPLLLSPFGFDLDDNLGIDSEDRLYVYDFEFVQWTSYGLQNLFLIHKLLQSRRQIFNVICGKGVALNLISLIQEKVTKETVDQAAYAYKMKLTRDQKHSFVSRLFHRYAHLFINSKC